MTPTPRYGIYFLPRGALARFGAVWLGWDIEGRCDVAAPEGDTLVPDRAEITATPRKYGFHATIKAPFRLAEGLEVDDLIAALQRLSSTVRAVHLPEVEVAALGQFLALRPSQDTPALQELAATVVRDLDPLRAPLTDAEIARRRQSHLTPEQDALMLRWGYPYVLDEFRFHMTLSGALAPNRIGPVQQALETALQPMLMSGLWIDALAVVRERPDGRFESVARIALPS